ncbi:unnamed protein product [Sphagnum jensenii]|uniref:Protein kinase domain-containing protein n=1 Tax=Sphagnum jensenii TaxID=128206 RepID=A0ABP0XL14_9BRYO
MCYGKLEDGKEVAIKVLDVKSSQGPSEFFNEVDVLSRVSHRNLVSLIGYCLEDDQKMLIYEYMHKGSLCDHLYGHLSTSVNEQLDWTTHLHIAFNASQGLEYLHSRCNPSIIHHNVKTNAKLLTQHYQIERLGTYVIGANELSRRRRRSNGSRIIGRVAEQARRYGGLERRS